MRPPAKPVAWQRAWRAVRRTPKHYLPPALPVIALAVMPFVPFVDAPGLWFGLPKMMVWAALWSLSLVPALRWSQRLMERHERGDRQ